jgi:hypothetical protein
MSEQDKINSLILIALTEILAQNNVMATMLTIYTTNGDNQAMDEFQRIYKERIKEAIDVFDKSLLSRYNKMA